VIAAALIALIFLLSSAPVATYDVRVTLLVFVVVVGALGSSFGSPLWVECAAALSALTVLTSLMTHAPGAFTLGEFFIVATLAALPVPAALAGGGRARFCAVALLAAVLCLSMSVVFKRPVCIGFFVLPCCFVIGGIADIAAFVLQPRRILLIGYCGAVCLVFVALSVFWKGLSRFPKIIQRKFFHLMALFVLIPPILIDCDFLRLAVCGAIVIFLLVESLRVIRFPFVGSLIEEYVAGFIDERDSGGLVLTHLFLLLGLGLPVLLSKSETPGGFLARLSGLSVLAVGDAAASIIGVNFGKHKWPGSKKSLEGTAGAFIGTWLCLFAIQQLAAVDLSWQNVVAISLPSLIGALDEAFTSQIDNLTLPFVMIPFAVLAKIFL
jgi:dolichol kinase